MNENRVQKYKLAKKISNQIEYLENKKHVQFNIMSKKIAGEKLLEYNYINIKNNQTKEVILSIRFDEDNRKFKVNNSV